MNHPVIAQIAALRVLPVVKINVLEQTLPLCEALCAGGLPAAEITFRTACAKDAIALAKKTHPDMLIGAGTVLTAAQAEDAIHAGAQFIISPGLCPEVVTYCMDCGIPVIPGCVTPTEIATAMQMGLQIVKFFPAEAFGGVKTIKALSAPYHTMRFIPTGGITVSNLTEYLSCPAVIACGGSFMVQDSFLADNAYDKITEWTRAAVACAAKVTK